MRDIIFRAKSKIDGGWVIGSVFHNKEMTEVLIRTATDDYAVNPETVGQYTGTDKNGTKVFEGDILGYKGNLIEVYFDKEYLQFRAKEKYGFAREIDYFCGYPCEFEIVGNIHDNPELMKEGESNE